MAPSATAAPADTDRTEVWSWNPDTRDFDAVAARRVDADQYEVLRARRGRITGALEPGDVVRCELSDGELIVRERVFSARLV